MNCPNCHKRATKVYSGNDTKLGYKRYRQCLMCDTRFATEERIIDKK